MLGLLARVWNEILRVLVREEPPADERPAEDADR
jgi:hypothetical protein